MWNSVRNPVAGADADADAFESSSGRQTDRKPTARDETRSRNSNDRGRQQSLKTNVDLYQTNTFYAFTKNIYV